MSIHLEESRSDKGASLVEVLVALVILTAALTPAFYVSNSALSLAAIIRDNMVASNLAQEGIEVVRSIRDANWFNGVAFNAGLSNNTYQVEWNTTSLTDTGDNFLRLSAAGLYNYSSGTATPFKRKITLTNISADQIRVQSVVTWTSRRVNHTVTIEAYVFNWK